jgi:alpha-L-rhamnosidase
MVMCGALTWSQQAPTVSVLRVDELAAPIGIDDPMPRLSWQMRDSRQGARQAAYRLLVASRPELLVAGSPDIWDSGRVESSQSVAVPYGGPRLFPSTRYYWTVQVWDSTDGSVSVSKASWWETGLMNENAWARAQWIGYETPEEAAVRHAQSEWITNPDPSTHIGSKVGTERVAYRAEIVLSKPVRYAALYATAQDTVSAWIDGRQELAAQPMPSWKQMPWKKFVRAVVTESVLKGHAHTLAIESLHYVASPESAAADATTPMIATLVVEYMDGSWDCVGTGTAWKTARDPRAGWKEANFNDTEWRRAVTWRQEGNTAKEALGNPWIPDSVKSLRHEFEVANPVKSARLYATALGSYEMYVNGRREGDQVLAPGWTDYRERVVYQTYDVTALLRVGRNALGALLAPGWYEDPLEWTQRPNNYGVTPPALRAELRIEYTDGRVEWVSTDTNWQANRSPILHSEIYNGETQDARQTMQGWDKTGFAAADWKRAILIDPEPVRIEAQDFPPIRVAQTLQAVKLTEPKPGVWVYDFGQNMAGVERVRVQGKEGTDVQLRFAEVLNTDGTIYTDNLRTAKATDHFILSGKSMDEFVPQFTYHGFRYAELTGLSTAPAKGAVSALVFHTDAPFTAKLTTGSAMINKLWSNILWGQRSNFMSVPTDCPQRDERLGWMADAQVFWRAASFNADLAAFSRKFAGDMRGTQVDTPYYGIYSPGTAEPNMGTAAGWSDAGIIVPWTSWLQTGDTKIIDENWSAMTKYLDAIEEANPNGLRRNAVGTTFGDWLSPEGNTNNTLIATAYWAYDVSLMSEMARATGRTAEMMKFGEQFEFIRSAFDKEFVEADGFVSGAEDAPSGSIQADNPSAHRMHGDTQTGYVLALAMNLLPNNLRAPAAKLLAHKIEANHDLLGTGFLGTPFLLDELTKAGYEKLAYTLLLQTTYPSWGYMVENGATTMWERWNGSQMMNDPGMNSFNHYAYGAVAAWIYRYAAGVDATPLDAGFHTIVLHPVFDRRLDNVDFTYESVYGQIRSHWKVRGSTAEWTVTIPANTQGRLDLTPEQVRKMHRVDRRQREEIVTRAVGGDGKVPITLEAGTYNFSIEL